MQPAVGPGRGSGRRTARVQPVRRPDPVFFPREVPLENTGNFMVDHRRFVALLASILLASLLAGAALAEQGVPGLGVDPSPVERRDDEALVLENDPLEPANRVVFEVNRRVLWYTARPIALLWRSVLPEPLRDGFRNGLDNLDSPLIIGNQVLQGDPGAASRTFARMVVNSTLGIGGLIDVAQRFGIRGRGTDLGLTLGSWGIFDGPYLVFPLLGPTTPRDAFGSFAQGTADPFNLWVQNTDYAFYAFLVRFVLGNIDRYARRIDELDRIEEEAVDFYASLRNLYLQKRRADIRKILADGAPVPTGIDYGIDFDDLESDDPESDDDELDLGEPDEPEEPESDEAPGDAPESEPDEPSRP